MSFLGPSVFHVIMFDVYNRWHAARNTISAAPQPFSLHSFETLRLVMDLRRGRRKEVWLPELAQRRQPVLLS